MGKVGDLTYESPDEVANRVVDHWVTTVLERADAMGDKYLERIRSADTRRMRRLLAEWYGQGLPQFANAVRQVWSRAPAPIRR